MFLTSLIIVQCFLCFFSSLCCFVFVLFLQCWELIQGPHIFSVIINYTTNMHTQPYIYQIFLKLIHYFFSGNLVLFAIKSLPQRVRQSWPCFVTLTALPNQLHCVFYQECYTYPTHHWNLISYWRHNSKFHPVCLGSSLSLHRFDSHLDLSPLSGKQLQFRRSDPWRGCSDTEEHIRRCLSKSWQAHHHLHDWSLWPTWHYPL